MLGRLGSGELLIILAIILVVFGPSRLPSLARTLGHAVRGVRSARKEFDDQVDDVKRTVER